MVPMRLQWVAECVICVYLVWTLSGIISFLRSLNDIQSLTCTSPACIHGAEEPTNKQKNYRNEAKTCVLALARTRNQKRTLFS